MDILPWKHENLTSTTASRKHLETFAVPTDELKTNAVGFIRFQLQGLFSELSIILLQSNATELDKASDYISVSFNDIHVLSLITPVNHKRKSTFLPIPLLFLAEHTDHSSAPNLVRILRSEVTASKYTKHNTTSQSHSERCVAYMSGYCTEIGLGIRTILVQTGGKRQQSSKTFLIHTTPLPVLHSSTHGPFYQDPASVLMSLPMQTNR